MVINNWAGISSQSCWQKKKKNIVFPALSRIEIKRQTKGVVWKEKPKHGETNRIKCKHPPSHGKKQDQHQSGVFLKECVYTIPCHAHCGSNHWPSGWNHSAIVCPKNHNQSSIVRSSVVQKAHDSATQSNSFAEWAAVFVTPCCKDCVIVRYPLLSTGFWGP